MFLVLTIGKFLLIQNLVSGIPAEGGIWISGEADPDKNIPTENVGINRDPEFYVNLDSEDRAAKFRKCRTRQKTPGS